MSEKNTIVEDAKVAVKADKKAKKDAVSNDRNNKLKKFASSMYINLIKFIAEVIEAAFAYAGITTFIHTSPNIQSTIAVIFIGLILVVKFNIKK